MSFKGFQKHVLTHYKAILLIKATVVMRFPKEMAEKAVKIMASSEKSRTWIGFQKRQYMLNFRVLDSSQ